MELDLVKSSKVKELVKDQGLNMSGDSVEKLNKDVSKLIINACTRAKQNNRRTLQYRDL